MKFFLLTASITCALQGTSFLDGYPDPYRRFLAMNHAPLELHLGLQSPPRYVSEIIGGMRLRHDYHPVSCHTPHHDPLAPHLIMHGEGAPEEFTLIVELELGEEVHITHF